MRLIIAHHSQLRLARIRQQLLSAHPCILAHDAATLSGSYHLAEHQRPDGLLISEELARQPEFELLAALLRILDIACVVMSPAGDPQTHPNFEGIFIVPETAVCEAVSRIAPSNSPETPSAGDTLATPQAVHGYDPDSLILIGASTGGIDALLTVTQNFGAGCPPTLIVQHTSGKFLQSLIKLLDGACQASVMAAKDDTPLQPGQIYLAPDDSAHLTIAPHAPARITLSRDAPISGHRPAIDALFASGLPHANHVSAALLTGMGKDGAQGLTQLRRAGAYTIGQDQATSVVYGMPRVAHEMGGVCTQLPISRIGPALLNACRRGQRV